MPPGYDLGLEKSKLVMRSYVYGRGPATTKSSGTQRERLTGRQVST
jgi:hypothetical protein